MLIEHTNRAHCTEKKQMQLNSGLANFSPRFFFIMQEYFSKGNVNTVNFNTNPFTLIFPIPRKEFTSAVHLFFVAEVKEKLINRYAFTVVQFLRTLDSFTHGLSVLLNVLGEMQLFGDCIFLFRFLLVPFPYLLHFNFLNLLDRNVRWIMDDEITINLNLNIGVLPARQ